MKVYQEYVGKEKEVYVKCMINEKEAPNVIFFMTPIGSVENEVAVNNYLPLYDKGFNVFAVDLPGIGNSHRGSFTYENIKEAIKRVAEYIKETCSDAIHLYGGTGTGGIIGQALASDEDLPYFKSYSQFGVGNHGDLSVIGNGLMLKAAFPILTIAGKLFPKYRLKFKVPKYNGYNAKKENQWYATMMKETPEIFDLPLEVVNTLLWVLIAKESPLKKTPSVPTLVLAAKHDRYFSTKYIDHYYGRLDGKKNIHWLEDSHCAFVWRTGELTDHVAEWIECTS